MKNTLKKLRATTSSHEKSTPKQPIQQTQHDEINHHHLGKQQTSQNHSIKTLRSAMHVYYLYMDTLHTDVLMEKHTEITALNAIVTLDHNETRIMEETTNRSIDRKNSSSRENRSNQQSTTQNNYNRSRSPRANRSDNFNRSRSIPKPTWSQINNKSTDQQQAKHARTNSTTINHYVILRDHSALEPDNLPDISIAYVCKICPRELWSSKTYGITLSRMQICLDQCFPYKCVKGAKEAPSMKKIWLRSFDCMSPQCSVVVMHRW
jgi:hypothetical protein